VSPKIGLEMPIRSGDRSHGVEARYTELPALPRRIFQGLALQNPGDRDKLAQFGPGSARPARVEGRNPSPRPGQIDAQGVTRRGDAAARTSPDRADVGPVSPPMRLRVRPARRDETGKASTYPDEDPIERQADLRALQGRTPPRQGVRHLLQPPAQAAPGLIPDTQPNRTSKTGRPGRASHGDQDGCPVSSASTFRTTSGRSSR
jgi:hypothetical protein